jgi:hypothetical protein
MNHQDICNALQTLRPGAVWTLRGEGLADLEWLDNTQTRPSEDAIMACINDTAYRALRISEYPFIGDQLDAIMKGGQTFADMQAKCMAVKAKYPKGV